MYDNQKFVRIRSVLLLVRCLARMPAKLIGLLQLRQRHGSRNPFSLTSLNQDHSRVMEALQTQHKYQILPGKSTFDFSDEEHVMLLQVLDFIMLHD